MKKLSLSIVFLLGLSVIAQAQLNPFFNIVTDPELTVQKLIEGLGEYIVYSAQSDGIQSTRVLASASAQQDKVWYNSLKKVKSGISSYEKIIETVQMIADTKNAIASGLDKVSHDKNFTVPEIIEIAGGYETMIAEGLKLLDDLALGAQDSDLSLTDKKRLDLIDRVYDRVGVYKNLVYYYTRKNMSVSWLRTKKKNDAAGVLHLYGK